MSIQEPQNEEENENSNNSNIPISIKEPIYVMTIELDQGKSSHIEIYSDSIPEEVSYEFCRKNNLDYQSLSYLKKQIEELLNENMPKESHISPPIPKPQSKLNKPKEKDERVQVTPFKSSLFSCESFFITLQERNLMKSNRKNSINQSIPSIKSNLKTETLNTNAYNNEDNNQKNRYSTPLQTDSHNKHYYPIPHPQYNKREAGSFSRMNNWESEKCSKLSSNFFKESSSRSNSQSNKNIGVKLYERGNLLLEKKNRKIEEMRNDLNRKDAVELTFTPVLNHSSSKKKVINNSHIKTKIESFTEIPPHNKLPLKINSNGLTSPSLVKAGARINYQLSSHHNHNHHRKSQKKLSVKSDKTNNELAYHPHLTDYRLTEKTKLPFSSRLMLFKQQYEENSTKLKNDLTKNIDPKTGQPYFTPALTAKQQKRCKSPLNNNNIFDDLYNYASLYKTNKNKRKEIIDKEVKKMKKIKTSDHSEEIFQKKKENVFRKIFKIFDSDEDGLINIYSIDLNKIPNAIATIIMPIISDLKEYQGNINCDDFVYEGIKLIEVSIYYITGLY